MIQYRGETTYFEASSATVRFRDGLKHDFIDDNDDNGIENVDFFNMAIGDSLRFSYNSTSCMEQPSLIGPPTCTWPHSVHVVLTRWHEDSFNWELSQAWVTPGWRWEWIFRPSRERARVPLGFDVLRCDTMDLTMGLPSSTESMFLRDVTLGAYLPRNYSADKLRVFEPCGSGRECRIINNEVMCRGIRGLVQILPFLFAFIPSVMILRIVCGGIVEGIRRARSESDSQRHSYEMVDVDSLASVAGEEEWERRRQEEARAAKLYRDGTAMKWSKRT